MRFVGCKVEPAAQEAVCRNAISLDEKDQVAAHDLPPGDAPVGGAADDEGAGARQIAQRFESLLGASLLDDGDAHDDEDEAEEHQCVGGLARHEVERACGDQEDEHGFARDLEGDREHAPLLALGELVRALVAKPGGGLLLGEPLEAGQVEDIRDRTRRDGCTRARSKFSVRSRRSSGWGKPSAGRMPTRPGSAAARRCPWRWLWSFVGRGQQRHGLRGDRANEPTSGGDVNGRGVAVRISPPTNL